MHFSVAMWTSQIGGLLLPFGSSASQSLKPSIKCSSACLGLVTRQASNKSIKLLYDASSDFIRSKSNYQNRRRKITQFLDGFLCIYYCENNFTDVPWIMYVSFGFYCFVNIVYAMPGQHKSSPISAALPRKVVFQQFNVKHLPQTWNGLKVLK